MPRRGSSYVIRPEEPFPGWTIVDEIRSPLGAALLALHRRVRLWAGVRLEQRRGLFADAPTDGHADRLAAVGAPPALMRALGPVLDLVRAPVRAQARRVALACLRVSAWAEAEGHLGTALAWAQAACGAGPQAPHAVSRSSFCSTRRSTAGSPARPRRPNNRCVTFARVT